MKVVIPLAGKGTRLQPVTNHVPKPLLRVAGRPVLDHVMDTLAGLDIEELIFITGHLKEQVEEYVTSNYDYSSRFIEQVVQDGTAGAVNLAKPFIEGPLLIVFVDTLFDADLSVITREDADGIIWVKEVEDYQRFGVVVTNERGEMTRIVEKPSEPVSKLANIGLYHIRDWQLLFEGIQHTLGEPANQGEWYLTDAFQYMIDHGSRIRTAEVGGWYDCGKIETLLETNQHLLEQEGGTPPPSGNGVRIIQPVRLGDNVELADSTIGPNVTLEDGATVIGSVLQHTIVGRRARVVNAQLEYSLIGDEATVADRSGSRLIAAGDDVRAAP